MEDCRHETAAFRKRKRKEGNVEPISSSVNSVISATPTLIRSGVKQQSSGEAVAAAIRFGMSDANKLNAIKLALEIGSEEEKAFAKKKLMDMCGKEDLSLSQLS